MNHARRHQLFGAARQRASASLVADTGAQPNGFHATAYHPRTGAKIRGYWLDLERVEVVDRLAEFVA